jgi:hypothetical protein
MYSFTQAALNLGKKRGNAVSPEKKLILLTVEKTLERGPWSPCGEIGPSPQERERLGLMSFGELTAEGLVMEVRSEVLGETILLVPDTYTPSPEDPVTYTHAEMKVLMDADEDLVKDAHQIKKTFKARVLSAEKIEETP